MTKDKEQHSHKLHPEESWPLFMSLEQREQLIRNKFARAVQHFKFHGEKYPLNPNIQQYYCSYSYDNLAFK